MYELEKFHEKVDLKCCLHAKHEMIWNGKDTQ